MDYEAHPREDDGRARVGVAWLGLLACLGLASTTTGCAAWIGASATGAVDIDGHPAADGVAEAGAAFGANDLRFYDELKFGGGYDEHQRASELVGENELGVEKGDDIRFSVGLAAAAHLVLRPGTPAEAAVGVPCTVLFRLPPSPPPPRSGATSSRGEASQLFVGPRFTPELVGGDSTQAPDLRFVLGVTLRWMLTDDTHGKPPM